MSNAKRLREIAKQYRCPWGDPGSNPDYLSLEDYSLLLASADEIERLRVVVEDAIETMGAMDLHVDNPLYERLRAALDGN